ncbi:MAG: signal transduction histidine kinase [Roseivirga sp.]
MKALKFKRVIYIISATAVITVGIQIYRNLENYAINKQRFTSEMQEALDTSVEAYFADRAKRSFVVIENSFTNSRKVRQIQLSDSIIRNDSRISLDSQFRATTRLQKERIKNDSINYFSSQSGAKIGGQIDSILNFSNSSFNSITIANDTWTSDSIKDIRGFVKNIMFSITRDTIDFEKMEGFLKSELDRRGIEAGHALWHYKNDEVYTSNEDFYPLSTTSKSTFLPRGQSLEMKFDNASMFILKRGALDLLISLLISAAVIGSLLYLYRIINEQKQLADIKNDLISNITHEFKTPIATVSTAIEAISNFNQANDQAKTAKYLDISSGQLLKLNAMVEKLLETASLDSDELELSLESVELVNFTQQIFDKFQLIKGDKKLLFQTDISEIRKDIDSFHMENAVSNLVDNAIKYGGDEITIRLSSEKDKMLWQVTDNGGKIEKLQQQRIFDQFYRIPTGNLHDVKGFGIGLYYTKKIVEKHRGEITLDVSPNTTDFTIQI